MEKLTVLVGEAELGRADPSSLLERLEAAALALAGWFAGEDADLRADLEQEVRLALWRAEKTFRPGWKAGFCTYAWACVRNALLDYVKGERRWALRWISLDEETVAAVLDQQAADRWHGGAAFLERMAGLQARAQIENRDLRRVLAVLTEAEWRVLKRSVVDQESDAAIAAALGKTQAAVKQLRYRARRKIQRQCRHLFAGEAESR